MHFMTIRQLILISDIKFLNFRVIFLCYCHVSFNKLFLCCFSKLFLRCFSDHLHPRETIHGMKMYKRWCRTMIIWINIVPAMFVHGLVLTRALYGSGTKKND